MHIWPRQIDPATRRQTTQVSERPVKGGVGGVATSLSLAHAHAPESLYFITS